MPQEAWAEKQGDHVSQKKIIAVVFTCVWARVLSHVWLFAIPWLLGEPSRLLCSWDTPGKNTGVGCHFFLQGNVPTQGPNPSLLCLLQWQEDSLPLSHPGKPSNTFTKCRKAKESPASMVGPVRGGRSGLGKRRRGTLPSSQTCVLPSAMDRRGGESRMANPRPCGSVHGVLFLVMMLSGSLCGRKEGMRTHRSPASPNL